MQLKKIDKKNTYIVPIEYWYDDNGQVQVRETYYLDDSAESFIEQILDDFGMMDYEDKLEIIGYKLMIDFPENTTVMFDKIYYFDENSNLFEVTK